MIDLTHLDPNFKTVEAKIEGTEFHDVRKADVDFYGLYNPRTEPVFCRMPIDVAMEVSERTALLSQYTSGGQIRFKTDSRRLILRVKQDGRKKTSPHMTSIAGAGFDVYLAEDGKQRYWASIMPPVGYGAEWMGATYFPDHQMRDIVLNLPVYNGLIDLEIGLSEGAVLMPGSKYPDIAPVVYYGSSITEGGCATRPGLIYEAMLTRRLNIPQMNFGFSGNAKGEKRMAEYVAEQPASVFVVDYDHNATRAADLEATHEIFVRTIREKNPTTPILMISRAKVPLTDTERDTINVRKEIIRKTYENLVQEGDKNVAFLDGQTIYCGDDCTVDGTHPNDLGMKCMADAIEPYLRKFLFGEEA